VSAFGRTWPANLWFYACGFGLVATLVFLTFPKIDLSISGAFHVHNGAFSGQSLRWVHALRGSFTAVFYLCIGVSLAGLILTRYRARRWLNLDDKQWLFLAMCLSMGPGVLANVVLKDHWGRARPKQVVEFGGAKTFTPPMIPTDQCANNCSFVSGEAAAIFMPFYALGLIVPQWTVTLLAAGTVCGFAAGFVRIAQGAHFLSDVIFAGVFMAMTAGLAYRALFGRSHLEEPNRSIPGTPGEQVH
jgi:lipid A 4'-phosphatase